MTHDVRCRKPEGYPDFKLGAGGTINILGFGTRSIISLQNQLPYFILNILRSY